MSIPRNGRDPPAGTAPAISVHDVLRRRRGCAPPALMCCAGRVLRGRGVLRKRGCAAHTGCSAQAGRSAQAGMCRACRMRCAGGERCARGGVLCRQGVLCRRGCVAHAGCAARGCAAHARMRCTRVCCARADALHAGVLRTRGCAARGCASRAGMRFVGGGQGRDACGTGGPGSRARWARRDDRGAAFLPVTRPRPPEAEGYPAGGGPPRFRIPGWLKRRPGMAPHPEEQCRAPGPARTNNAIATC